MVKEATGNPAYAEMLRRSIAAAEPEILAAIEDGNPEAADALARLWLDKQTRVIAAAA
jgi:hypothetical protein